MTRLPTMTFGRTLALLALLVAVLGCGKKGFDLRKGGTELVYSVKAPAETNLTAALPQARKILLERLAAMEIKGAVVLDGEKLRVLVPREVQGAQLEEVKSVIGVQGKVEVCEVGDGSALRAAADKLSAEIDAEVTQESWNANGRRFGTFVMLANGEEAGLKALSAVADFKLPSGSRLLATKPSGRGTVHMYEVQTATLTQDDIRAVSAPRDPYLPPEVVLQFTEKGAQTFKAFTERIRGRKMAIVLDGTVMQTEVIMNPAVAGRASIAFDNGVDRKVRQRQADLLAIALRHGPLPVAIKLEEERTLPTLR